MSKRKKERKKKTQKNDKSQDAIFITFKYILDRVRIGKDLEEILWRIAAGLHGSERSLGSALFHVPFISRLGKGSKRKPYSSETEDKRDGGQASLRSIADTVNYAGECRCDNGSGKETRWRIICAGKKKACTSVCREYASAVGHMRYRVEDPVMDSRSDTES